MEQNELTPEEYLEISEKVRSGEYFREARAMVDLEIHEPMTDRYWFVMLTVISLIIVFSAFFALQSLYPLKPRIPFIYGANDIVDDLPRIKTLQSFAGENADVALRRFLVSNYVKEREEYNVDTFDRNVGALQTMSAPSVFKDYYASISASNPNSPVLLYGRQAQRDIKILSIQPIEQAEEKDKKTQDAAKDFVTRVLFAATLQSNTGKNSTTRWQVDVAFKYEPIKLDSENNKIKPYGFIVTDYKAKPL